MISFENVWKSYTKELFTPSNTALAGVSFTLEKGRTLGLIGNNGAGKSTSIRLLMDFIRPDKGTIKLFNTSPRVFANRGSIGYLPETATFPANLNIQNLLRFTGTTCGIAKKLLQERSEYWLKALDLWEARKRPLRSYSKGMQQRANFVAALINDPELLILDEPMSGLDPIGRGKIIDLIQTLQDQGKTILFCSHILDDVDKLVDNVLVLHKGKSIFYGTPAELTHQHDASCMADAFIRLVQQ
jgi:ABC-2 type transport system ATP-binding protein